MKILIVPDSFKGTLTSKQVCECIANGISQVSDAEITAVPFSDGGEGFAECLADICKAKPLYTTCSDIYSKQIKGVMYTYEKTAIIECAVASGIQKKKDVMNATSYGTGELIKHAVSKGFTNIILGLGGSGCCDGGAGALSALGVEFKNNSGEIIPSPKGKDLSNIYGVNFKNSVKHIDFTYACDVKNAYFGKNGAAYVFAPQKGANKDDVIKLDEGLKMINAFLPNDVSHVKGAGAAGGLCGGLYGVYGGKICSGFDILSQACSLEEKIKASDIIITGEGKTDKQTLMGKLPYEISCLAAKYGKKCYVISGSIDNVKIGDKMLSLVDNDTSLEQAMENSSKILTLKAKLLLQ
ncbi:MAG: glycerate kinase [Clostridiales bacterium]|nr:glycerate kinase [Clostridiales bacterium]